MAEERNSFMHIVNELNAEENTYLLTLFKDPVLIKYFKNIAYAALLEQATMSIDDLVASSTSPEQDMKYRIQQAYQKGVLSLAELVLNTSIKTP
jgi:DNA-binding MltR family transcriptional regulator